MKSLKEQIAELRAAGYKALTAQAKVAHDAVLLAMHRSGFKLKSAIKGGVVMSSITGDVRRATMDMDMAVRVGACLCKQALSSFGQTGDHRIP